MAVNTVIQITPTVYVGYATQAATAANFQPTDTPQQSADKQVIYDDTLAALLSTDLLTQAGNFQIDNTTVNFNDPTAIAAAITAGTFDFDAYKPAAVSPISAPNQSSFTDYSVCSPNTVLTDAASQFAQYYNDKVTTVVDILSKKTQEQFQNVDASSIQSANSAINGILTALGDPNAALTTTEQSGNKTTVKVTPGNLVTFDQLSAYETTGVAASKLEIEANLRKMGLYFVNGKYIKKGDLNVSCAKTLGRLVGYDCVSLKPFLTLPEGGFVTVITYKVLSTDEKFVPCRDQDPNLPTGDCNPIKETLITEIVIGTNISISQALVLRPDLTVDDLSSYVFWIGSPDMSQKAVIRLANLGYTLLESANIQNVQSTDTIAVCVIGDAQEIYDFVCNNPQNVLELGPDGVDPDPTSQSVIDELSNAIENPTSVTGQDGEKRQDTSNLPLMVLSVLDVEESIGCGFLLGDTLNDIDQKTTEAQNSASAAYDFAINSLKSVQGVATGIGNKIDKFTENIKRAVETLLNDGIDPNNPNSPGSQAAKFFKCLFQGAGISIGLSLPAAILSGLQQALNFAVTNILGIIRLIEALLLALLNGFCISASAIFGVLAVAATVPGLDCANFNIPWPEQIRAFLECLLAIIRLIQKIINKAVELLRALFATLQSLAFSFNLSLGTPVNVCNPAVVTGLVTSIATVLGTNT